MNKAGTKISILAAMLFALIVAIAAPATALAQGNSQGHGRGHGQGRGSNYDKKCAKFVNCHDARDGRVDGRGPNRRDGVWRNGLFFPHGTRVRNRIIDRNDGSIRSRRAAARVIAQRRALARRNR
jgi:hypothetical protein